MDRQVRTRHLFRRDGQARVGRVLTGPRGMKRTQITQAVLQYLWELRIEQEKHR